MVGCKQDHKKFEDIIQQSLSSKTVIRKLSREFELFFDFKALCAKFPTTFYLENLELEVLAEEVVKLETPMTNQWKMIENYSKSKQRLRQG